MPAVASATMGTAAAVEAPTATVRSTATVESAPTANGCTAMESAAANRCRSVETSAGNARAMESAAGVTASYVAAASTVIAASAAPRATPASIPVPGTPVPPISPAPAPQPSRTMEPWASPNEEAANKPIGTVVAVRRTGVRSISVISVLAHRRSANRYAHRTDAHSHAHLRLREREWNHQHRQHRNIFHVLHNHLPLPESALYVAWILKLLSKSSTHLNRTGGKKLRLSDWLISAILVEINHLQGMAEAQRAQGLSGITR
jgi:hypothetical protein